MREGPVRGFGSGNVRYRNLDNNLCERGGRNPRCARSISRLTDIGSDVHWPASLASGGDEPMSVEQRPACLIRSEPILAVSDVVAAIRHYRDVLGFANEWTWGEPPDF